MDSFLYEMSIGNYSQRQINTNISIGKLSLKKGDLSQCTLQLVIYFLSKVDWLRSIDMLLSE